MLLTSNFDRFDLNPFEEKMLFRLHAVWSTRVLNIRSSTQIWPKNKSNKVYPIIIVRGLSIHISTLKGHSLDLQSSAESLVHFLSFGIC